MAEFKITAEDVGSEGTINSEWLLACPCCGVHTPAHSVADCIRELKSQIEEIKKGLPSEA